jgi:hypothetical protein
MVSKGMIVSGAKFSVKPNSVQIQEEWMKMDSATLIL